MSALLVNAAHVVPRSRANGPGERFVLWVQGCSVRCPGCHNPHTWAQELRRPLEVPTIIEAYERISGVRGITLSGGEPFEQAVALAALARGVRDLGGDVVAFSGYPIETLRNSSGRGVQALLDEVDLLIDGPFDAASPTRDPLRGSANQRVHHLSDLIRPTELHGLPRGEWVGGEGGGHLSGFLQHRLTRGLRSVQAPSAENGE